MGLSGHSTSSWPLRTPTLTRMDEIERWSPLKAWVYSLISRDPKSNSEVVEFADLSEDDRFLDIGCGPGAALSHAVRTGAKVAGLDPSPSMVQRAQKRVPAAEVKLGSAEDIPFPDDYFTVVINILSFHHWADRDAGLKEVARVLAPGGRLHVVEGRLREGKDGHGLSPSDAKLLASRLKELGYSEARIDEIKPGLWFRYVVVSATA